MPPSLEPCGFFGKPRGMRECSGQVNVYWEREGGEPEDEDE